jgi:EmrB/QacA subfamily drug resistance transporter
MSKQADGITAGAAAAGADSLAAPPGAPSAGASAAPPAPPSVALRSWTGAALITATVLASATTAVDANVIKVAVPAIGRSLGASVTALQWTLTSYLLVVAALLLLAGALSDWFGRRRLLGIGLLVMLVGSVLCAVAPSIGTLIAARVVQGIGAALVVPTSLALLNGTLRDADRARGIGLWAGLETLGTTVGPYVGGWLVDRASWRAVFLLNIPLILGGLLALWYVPESGRTRGRFSLDIRGALLAVAGLGGVVYALTAGPDSGWLSAPVLVAGVAGVVCLASLVPAERRRRAPMLRLSLFVSRQFDAINVMTLVLYGALGAASYLVILECELRLGYSAAEAGAALIPESVVFLILAPLSGVLVARLGPRWMMTGGIIAVTAGLFWLSAAHPGESYAAAILPGALLWGLGIGLAVTPLTAAVLAAVGDADLGEASGINDAASRVGGVVVIAVVPALIGATGGGGYAHAIIHGYQPAMIVMGGLCVAAALITVLFVTDNRKTGKRAPGPRIVPRAPEAGCAAACVPPTPAPVPAPVQAQDPDPDQAQDPAPAPDPIPTAGGLT